MPDQPLVIRGTRHARRSDAAESSVGDDGSARSARPANACYQGSSPKASR